MILIPFLALILGILIGTILATDVALGLGPYFGVAILACLDSVFGGSRSVLEGKFQTDIFISGFIANIAASVFLVWLGDNIGISLLSAAAVVFGIRIFTNLSLIRRIVITRVTDARDRRKYEADQAKRVSEEG